MKLVVVRLLRALADRDIPFGASALWWSLELDERWGTGVWPAIDDDRDLDCACGSFLTPPTNPAYSAPRSSRYDHVHLAGVLVPQSHAGSTISASKRSDSTSSR